VRLLTVGVDEGGRSCLSEVREIVPSAIDGLPGSSMASLFSTFKSPPPPSPPGLGSFIEDRLGPGLVSWYVIEHAPRGTSPDEQTPATALHWRNAIDLVFVLEGGGKMILGDGAHPVSSGDCIVMAGSDHGLRPDPGGCRLMAFAIGTPPA
jgi:hypothetical protein